MADQPQNGKSGWDIAGDLLGKAVGGALEYFTASQEQDYNQQSLDLQKYRYGTPYNPYYAQGGGSGGAYPYGSEQTDIMKYLPLIAIAGVGLILLLKA